MNIMKRLHVVVHNLKIIFDLRSCDIHLLFVKHTFCECASKLREQVSYTIRCFNYVAYPQLAILLASP